MGVSFSLAWRSVLAFTLLLSVACGVAVGEPSRPSPLFTGTELPQPPEQKKPWTPPDTELPQKLLSATTALFDTGLADPRGGEYRKIRVSVGSCWSGDGGVVETHGWVLPADKGTDRFAVCWNGLVYPVVKLGEPADLRADVLALVEADEKLRAESKNFYRMRNAVPEGYAISCKAFLPIQTCLLLRLGQGELAQKHWSAWVAGMRAKTNDDGIHIKDPYLMLAADWLWSCFDRSVCAHMRGDDRLALLDTRALAGWREAVEAEAGRRGFKLQSDERHHFDFLGQVPALLEDQERRAEEGKRKPLPAMADQAQRIAALILDLENVAARQWGQPGGVNLSEDPIMTALIEQGDAAVEPLIECLQIDTRLTRSVAFGRDFHRDRSIKGVSDAAYAALVEILRTSTFDTGPEQEHQTNEERRIAVAAGIRDYWKRFKDVSLEERWYLALKDDEEFPKQWLQAGENITQPVDVHNSISSGWITMPPRKPGEKPPMAGEVLRAKKDPSVTELLIRRVEAMSQLGEPGSDRYFRFHDACDMGSQLSKWDPKASAATLANLQKICREFPAKDMAGGQPGFGPIIARLTLQRVKAGDEKALDEYAAWIRTIEPSKVQYDVDKMLIPMWEHPEHAAIATAAESIFGGSDSAWGTWLVSGHFDAHDVLHSPLLGLAGFRKLLLTQLDNHQRAGTFQRNAEGRDSMKMEKGYSTRGDIDVTGDPLAPAVGVVVPFRVCDLFADRLSWIQGFPRCELYWPEAKRNEAVEACKAFLNKYGDRFRYSAEMSPKLRKWSDEHPANLIFPRRDRPATAEEVRDGQAIFALEQPTQARIWPMPEFPMKARWVTLKDYPYQQSFYDPKTRKSGTRTEYRQDGLVWQAEEVLQDGKWQRYYGFVGRYVIAKVPAEQIEFAIHDYPWAELKGGIDCWAHGPAPKKQPKGVPVTNHLQPGDPLVLHVRLRNRSGLEQAVPAEIIRQDPNRGVLLHAGIQLRLARAASDTNLQDEAVEPTWTELTPKARPHFRSEALAKTAAPGEMFAEFDLDIVPWFDITEPGRYRAQLVFDTQDGGFASGKSAELDFQLDEKTSP